MDSAVRTIEYTFQTYPDTYEIPIRHLNEIQIPWSQGGGGQIFMEVKELCTLNSQYSLIINLWW